MKRFVLVASFTAVSAQLDCGPASTIAIAGSIIVEPIAVAWANGYNNKCPYSTITIDGGGNFGARRVCNFKSAGSGVDIGNMSRDWTATEVNKTGTPGKLLCNIGNRGRPIIQIDVAIDGIAIALNNAGRATECLRRLKGGGLSIDQLRWIYSNYTTNQLNKSGWDPASIPFDDNNETTHKWNEINDTCPDGEIKLSAPSVLSAAYEIFREQVLVNRNEGIATKRPNGILQSADDDVLVQFLQTSSEEIFGDAISFFSLSSFFNEGQALYGVPIKAKGASVWVHPNVTTIGNGTYKPFSHRIYMNVYERSLARTGPFISYGLSQEGIALVKQVGFIPIPSSELPEMLARIGRLPPPVAAPVAEPVAVPIVLIDAPVAAPVASPAAAPTSAPVAAPVTAPLAEPVTAPVAEPVVAVPVVLIDAPVAAPISAPVTAPVVAPVPEPVTAPVVLIDAPVSAPVPVPIPVPVFIPVPVVAPRLPPTKRPTVRPTKSPTRKPTKTPSTATEPTKSPTEKVWIRRICSFRLFRHSRFCR